MPNAEILQLLLRHRADPLAVDDTRVSALHGHARYGTPEEIRVLIKHCAAVLLDSRDDSARMPL